MHVTGMVPGNPLHSIVANMPYCLIIVERPRGLIEGIHSIVSRNLVFGTLVLVVGDACDVRGVLDVLRTMCDIEGLPTIRIGRFILGSSTQQDSRGSLSSR